MPASSTRTRTGLVSVRVDATASTSDEEGLRLNAKSAPRQPRFVTRDGLGGDVPPPAESIPPSVTHSHPDGRSLPRVVVCTLVGSRQTRRRRIASEQSSRQPLQPRAMRRPFHETRQHPRVPIVVETHSPVSSLPPCPSATPIRDIGLAIRTPMLLSKTVSKGGRSSRPGHGGPQSTSRLEVA